MTPLQKIYLLRIALGITAAVICIGFLTATGSISRNLILDPSVETGNSMPSYWLPSVNGTEWSTAYAKTGFRSIRINVNNASAEWKSEVTAVREGDTYQTVGFFKGKVTADRFSLIIKWFSDLQGYYNITENKISIPIGNYTQWIGIGNVFTAPSGAKSCQIIFKAESASGDLYGDNFEVRQTQSTTVFLNSLSIALVVYLVSYYPIKNRFLLKVEKPRKIATTGIGIYFISWLVFWSLLYTLMATI
jgi:hypothetical protein